jgi:hypothetical protein
MPLMRIEPTIPVFEREKTVHALDRAATVIGDFPHCHHNYTFLPKLVQDSL